MKPRLELGDPVLAAIERERRRIGDQLHEKLCQSLAVLAIQVALLARHAKAGKAVDAELAELAANVNRAISQTYAVSHELQATNLQGCGLHDSLHALAQELGTPCEVVCDPELALPAATSLALLRIAEEAVRNAVRHAAAKQITISLRTKPRGLTLEICDDGQGFTPAPTTARPLSGLGLMRRHARAVHARLRLRSAPGKGTVISCSVPRDRVPEL